MNRDTQRAPSSAAIDSWAIDVLVVACAGILGWRVGAVGDFIDDLIVGRRGDLYGALLGLHATLLGFILAALAIVLGYASNPHFDIVRDSGHLRGLFAIFLAGTLTEALATAASLSALLVDRDKHQHVVLAALVGVLSVLALCRLARTLWVMRKVVSVVIQPINRAPGAN